MPCFGRMDTTILLAVAAVSALVAAIAALHAVRRTRRILDTKLLIGEAMRRRGVTPADAEAAGLEADMYVARERCADCRSEAACRVVLATPKQDVPSACPNQAFFAQLAAEKAVLQRSI